MDLPSNDEKQLHNLMWYIIVQQVVATIHGNPICFLLNAIPSKGVSDFYLYDYCIYLILKKIRDVAQMVERLLSMWEVRVSIPRISILFFSSAFPFMDNYLFGAYVMHALYSATFATE